MAKPTPRAAAGADLTHLVGRSVGSRFRRSGLDFGPEPRYWPLADLAAQWGKDYEAKLRAVLDERQVVARLATAADLDGARPGIEQLEDENASLRAQLADLEARLAALEAPKG